MQYANIPELLVCCAQVGDAPDTFPDMTRFAESGSAKAAMESSANPSTSDQEEPPSDDDVPYFSDIEAMVILEILSVILCSGLRFKLADA